MIPFSAILMASCLTVNSAADHITAGDLAPQFPGLETIPAETPLAIAPAPGVVRVFRIPELARLSANLHLNPPRAEICVQRPVTQLDPARMLAAMQAALPQARIQILEFTRRPVPDGELEFPRSGLHQGPVAAYWSGVVHYGGNRLFSIWAKVAVWVQARRVVALHDLQPGTVIEAGAVRVETHEQFPANGDFPDSLDRVIGQSVRSPIRAGVGIRAEQLEPPKQVLNGETVQVEVFSGGAHLKLEARAETSGVLGQVIPVRNLDSQKRFFARVEGKGRVIVEDSGAGSFTPEAK